MESSKKMLIKAKPIILGPTTMQGMKAPSVGKIKTKICKSVKIKSNEPNLLVIGPIEYEIRKRPLLVKSGTTILCKAVDIKSNEPNPVIIGPIKPAVGNCPFSLKYVRLGYRYQFK